LGGLRAGLAPVPVPGPQCQRQSLPRLANLRAGYIGNRAWVPTFPAGPYGMAVEGRRGNLDRALDRFQRLAHRNRPARILPRKGRKVAFVFPVPALAEPGLELVSVGPLKYITPLDGG